MQHSDCTSSNLLNFCSFLRSFWYSSDLKKNHFTLCCLLAQILILLSISLPLYIAGFSFTHLVWHFDWNQSQNKITMKLEFDKHEYPLCTGNFSSPQGDCKTEGAASGPSALKEELVLLVARIKIRLAIQHLHQYLKTPSHPQMPSPPPPCCCPKAPGSQCWFDKWEQKGLYLWVSSRLSLMYHYSSHTPHSRSKTFTHKDFDFYLGTIRLCSTVTQGYLRHKSIYWALVS